jgi:hypothetical protein
MFGGRSALLADIPRIPGLLSAIFRIIKAHRNEFRPRPALFAANRSGCSSRLQHRPPDGAARRLLIEAAWTYRFPARLSRELLLRQEAQPKPIREIAWKAQLRLCALSQTCPQRQTSQRRHGRDRP